MQILQKFPEQASAQLQLRLLESLKTSAEGKLISDDIYDVYGQILQAHCQNTIDENVWTIPFTDGIRHIKLSFEGLFATDEELRLIKAYITDTLSLYSSPSTCASKVKSLDFLFEFLHEKEFQITMLSTPVINLFHLWLDENKTLTAERKNLIEADLHGLISFLREHHLIRTDTIVIPRPRVTALSTVKRAPDKCTLAQLDAYFFDFSTSIPCAYRCLYLLLRLIPCRNHEAFSMMIDDFSVNDDLLEVRIPTFKETANHLPVYLSHYRLAKEYPERLLVHSLQEQRAYATNCQTHIEDPNLKYRLMISPRNPKKLVSSNEFNAFLEDICDELGITDAYGNPTHITMYSLRHANGAEMAQFPEITPQVFSRTFAHNSNFSDDGYGYASKHDEMLYTAPFVQQVHNELFPQDACSAAQHVTPTHLARLQREPFSHLIGPQSVCQERGCTPQFTHCVFCENYIPDPYFISEAERCCIVLQQRIEHCRVNGDDSALQFNEQQLSTYIKFIQRAEVQKGGETNGRPAHKS